MLMPVPIALTPSVRQWRCQMRGACCKVHRIQVDEREHGRIAKALREVGDARADVMEQPLPVSSGVPHLPMTKSDACIFLSNDNRCELRRFGTRVYPVICQKFPYLSVLTPERQIFSLTLQCPTALELFAHEGDFEVVLEPDDAEPPSDHLIYLGDEEREYRDVRGDNIDALAFWQTHWRWFELFRARTEADPLERLTRFAEQVTGEPAPGRAMLRPQQWVQSAFDGSLPRQLQNVSGQPVRGLPWLWLSLPPEDMGKLPVPNTDEHRLLLRYLLHRFHFPLGYVAHTDLRFHLSTLFAMAARYRIERARGSSPMLAIRHLDRLFVHVGAVSPILGNDGEKTGWQAYCSLANADTI